MAVTNEQYIDYLDNLIAEYYGEFWNIETTRGSSTVDCYRADKAQKIIIVLEKCKEKFKEAILVNKDVDGVLDYLIYIEDTISELEPGDVEFWMLNLIATPLMGSFQSE